MCIFQNAIKNIIRNKGRYLLLGGIITTMLITVTVSAMINSTTSEVIIDYVNRFSARVYFTHDLQKVMNMKPETNGMITVPEISTEQYMEFADSEYVKTTLFTGSIQAYGDSFLGLDQGGKKASENSGFYPETKIPSNNRQEPNCVVLGYSVLSSIEEFKLGQRAINSGYMFEKQGECVISDPFAKLNNLAIGDEISLFNVDDTEHKLTLKITGIYLDGTTEQANNAGLAVNNRRNQILTSYDTLTATGLDSVYSRATYNLHTPEFGEAFEKELREKGLPEYYNVNIDSSNYFQIVNPVKGLSKVSSIMLFAVLGFGSVILILLSALSVRERKYEIGVLRAMGMAKGKVAVGMLIESLTVIVICLVVGLGVGTSVAQPISSGILNDQLRIVQENYTPPETDYGDGIASSNAKNEVDYQTLANVRVKVTPNMIMLTIGIALLLGFLSNIVGIFYITRFEPIRILTERD